MEGDMQKMYDASVVKDALNFFIVYPEISIIDN